MTFSCIFKCGITKGEEDLSFLARGLLGSKAVYLRLNYANVNCDLDAANVHSSDVKPLTVLLGRIVCRGHDKKEIILAIYEPLNDGLNAAIDSNWTRNKFSCH